jgi:hypothetical protein
MTSEVKCSGPPAPEWMATVESIHEAAMQYRVKVPAIIQRTNAAVVGTQLDDLNICVEDRTTGVVFHWFDREQQIGSVAKVPTMCSSGPGRPHHKWTVHMRILRRAKISEVRKMARKWGGTTPLVLREGLWYQILTD